MKTLAELNKAFEVNQRSAEFAQLAALLARSQAERIDLTKLAEAASDRVQQVVKTVAVGTTTGTNWAAPLSQYRGLSDGFLESLRGMSAFDSAVNFMAPVSIKNKLLIASGASGGVVTEGSPAPVLALSFDSTGIDPISIVALTVLSSELLRLGTRTQTIVGTELRRSVAAATDAKFLTDAISGLSPLISSGETAAAFLEDLRALLAGITIRASARLFLAMSPANAKQLIAKPTAEGAIAFPDLTVSGGSIGGVQIVPTDGIAAATMTLFDATQFAADPGLVTLDVSTQGAVQMVSNPSGAAAMVSLYQTNSVAIKAWRQFGFVRGRTAAVATMNAVDYGDTGSGAI